MVELATRSLKVPELILNYSLLMDTVSQRTFRLRKSLVWEAIYRLARVLHLDPGTSASCRESRKVQRPLTCCPACESQMGMYLCCSLLQSDGVKRTCCRMGSHQTERVEAVKTYLSDPARSTNDSFPRVTDCVWRLVASMIMLIIKWERLDSLFIWVSLVCRLSWPLSIVCSSSRAEVTSITVAPGTCTIPFISFLISSLGPFTCSHKNRVLKV